VIHDCHRLALYVSAGSTMMSESFPEVPVVLSDDAGDLALWRILATYVHILVVLLYRDD